MSRDFVTTLAFLFLSRPFLVGEGDAASSSLPPSHKIVVLSLSLFPLVGCFERDGGGGEKGEMVTFFSPKELVLCSTSYTGGVYCTYYNIRSRLQPRLFRIVCADFLHGGIPLYVGVTLDQIPLRIPSGYP